MAHEVETMAYTGKTPWHGLGKAVRADLTPDQFLDEAGLNWEVKRIPLYGIYEDKLVTVDEMALIRTSDAKVLSTVSSDWEENQNRTFVEFFHEHVMSDECEIHTAGSLAGGSIVWMMAKLKNGFSLFGGDEIEGNLLFTNPHIYGKAIDIRVTPTRVVCKNTLMMALSGRSEYKVRIDHTKKFDPQHAKEMLGIASQKIELYKSMAEYLGSRRYTPDNVVEYFKQVFPNMKNDKQMTRNADIAHKVLETQPGANFAAGSWWQAFNAVTYTTDHLLGREAETRAKSAWYGVNRTRKLEALELAKVYAEAA